MKFEIAREEFLHGVARVQAIVDRRGTLPILANTLVEATEGTVRLIATDLEVGVICTQVAEVESAGRITLGAKKLYEIIRELEASLVTVETTEDSRVRLEADRSRFSLLSISPEEYPTLPTGEGAEFVPLEASILRDMIDRVFYAASSDETRYNLNGVRVEYSDDDQLSFVATDGHRLAKIDRSVSSAPDAFRAGVIIPRKGVVELRKLCDEAEGKVELAIHDGFFLVRAQGQQLSCRLIDSEFPNYKEVLPQNQPIRLVFERERLLHAVRRVSLVAIDRGTGFAFALDENLLQLSASNPDLGEAHEQLELEYSGPPLATRYDARYVIDALQAIPSKEVMLELIDDLSPAQIRPVEDPDQMAIVMPMRL